MRWRSATALLAAIVLQAVLLVPFSSPVKAEPGALPSTWGCSAEALDLDEVTLELAPVSRDEQEQDGSRITPTAGRDGSWVPVILVHGWMASGTHPNTDGTSDTAGTFSGQIDLWARPGPGQQSIPRSLIGQLQGVRGAAVFTYDYHPYAGRWVTDEHIGPGLGRAIRCLGQASGKSVVVIGHSMGGLALRQALAQEHVAEHVAVGITVGTPHRGSVAATIAAGLLTAAQVSALYPNWTSPMIGILTFIMSACGSASSKKVETGTLCDSLAPPLRAFDGQAGRALRAGSKQIKDLPPMPTGVPFHPLAGRSHIDVPGEGWFWLPGPRHTFELGDIVVGSDSALPREAADTQYSIDCAYRLTTGLGPHDSVRMLLGILAPEDVTQERGELVRGACFHTSLTQNIEITNEVMGITLEHVEPQTTPPWRLEDALLPPGSCTAWAGEEQWVQLSNGQGEARTASGEYADLSVLSVELVGVADVDGDGQDELVVSLTCSGSAIEHCCAGQTSIMTSVAAYRHESEGLRLVARGLMGGQWLPGDEYGPISRGINAAALDGSTLVTTEYTPYSHMYSAEDLNGHDPSEWITARYVVRDGSWVPES